MSFHGIFKEICQGREQGSTWWILLDEMIVSTLALTLASVLSPAVKLEQSTIFNRFLHIIRLQYLAQVYPICEPKSFDHLQTLDGWVMPQVRCVKKVAYVGQNQRCNFLGPRWSFWFVELIPNQTSKLIRKEYSETIGVEYFKHKDPKDQNW